MKKQWIVTAAAMGILSLSLTACKGDEISQADIQALKEEQAAIEEQQNKIIAEYAAGVLMKYNSGSNSRVLTGEKLLIEEAKEEAKKAQEEKRQQLFEEYEKEQKKEATDTKDSASTNEGKSGGSEKEIPQVQYVEDMSSLVGTSSFSIVYSGYEITDSYTEDLLSFTVDAKEGKVLLVTKFVVSNISGQEEELDVFSLEPEFRIKLSNKVRKAQQTMLLDDLSMYKGRIQAGEVKEAVILFEVSKEIADKLDNMELLIKTDAGEGRMLLEGTSGIVTLPEEELVVEEETINEEISIEEDMVEESEETIITTVGSNNNIVVEPAE